ncbi:MAG TPA: G1 family glutamic endopeptidase [Dehalococcoidia bacterium]|nr:G1 family glutamic endopeptidase [Dehalococcoidia bacterium]
MRITLRFLTAASATFLLSGAVASGPLVANASAIVHHPRVAAVARNAGWASSNWSGYAKTGTYSSATAAWVVPSVASSRKATYSSQWVGIDGFNNSSLIQTGTEADYYNGSAHYGAWWEILPAAETVIPSITVNPKDLMTASVTKGSGSSWTITIKDTTTGKSFTTTQNYTGPGTSVEWIEEAPSVGGHVATLATYSSPDTFDPGTANTRNPGLTVADGGVMIQKNRQVSTPSVPDSDTDGFNMAYGSTAPAAPGS